MAGWSGKERNAGKRFLRAGLRGYPRRIRACASERRKAASRPVDCAWRLRPLLSPVPRVRPCAWSRCPALPFLDDCYFRLAVFGEKTVESLRHEIFDSVALLKGEHLELGAHVLVLHHRNGNGAFPALLLLDDGWRRGRNGRVRGLGLTAHTASGLNQLA